MLALFLPVALAAEDAVTPAIDFSRGGTGYSTVLYDSSNGLPTSEANAIAETSDAMYSDRPYRKRMNFDKVVSIMKDASGTQLTADVVDAFLRLVEKGEMRDKNDTGGGSTDDIDNIHRKQNGGKDEDETKQ